jgi:hypothetical protein
LDLVIVCLPHKNFGSQKHVILAFKSLRNFLRCGSALSEDHALGLGDNIGFFLEELF